LQRLNASILNFRFVVVVLFTFISCQEKSGTVSFAEKEAALKAFEESIAQCKSDNIDSIIDCSRRKDSSAFQRSDTVQHRIWQNYGTAKALIENGFYARALPYIDVALPLAEGYSFQLEQAKLFDLRAAANGNLNNALASATDLYQAADLYSTLEKFPEAESCFLSTSNLQYNSGNYELAIKDGFQALTFFRKVKRVTKIDSTNSVNIFNTLGLANFHLNKLDSARKYFDLAKHYALALDNKLWIGLVTGNSAKIDVQKGHTQIAVNKLKQKLTACLDHQELAGAGSALVALAEIEVRISNFDEAKELYDSAWNLMKREKRPRIWIAYYQSVARWYELVGDYEKGHAHIKRYIELRDSVQGGNPISAQLLQLQSKNQFKKQLADLNLLKAENEVKNQELKVWQISIVAIIIISILLVVLLNTINKNYKKLNDLNGQLENKVKARTIELMKINKELDTYLYRSSHDVRRPILSIIGLTQLTNLVTGEEELREIQLKIEDTARAMDKMLRKLQIAYELDKVVDVETLELSESVKGITASMQRMYPKIQFDFTSNVHGLILSNTKLLDIIFTNIMENACIFSNPIRPKVTVDVKQDKDKFIVRITDNGIGIEKKYWTEMFKPYTRFSELSVGSGLGLHLVEKSLRKMNGDIQIDSALHKGTEIIVSLPVHKTT
jgi:signal transduction histidine kinase